MSFVVPGIALRAVRLDLLVETCSFGVICSTMKRSSFDCSAFTRPIREIHSHPFIAFSAYFSFRIAATCRRTSARLEATASERAGAARKPGASLASWDEIR